MESIILEVVNEESFNKWAENQRDLLTDSLISHFSNEGAD
jgi:hypothetical protein